jgi:hypothetical protein
MKSPKKIPSPGRNMTKNSSPVKPGMKWMFTLTGRIRTLSSGTNSGTTALIGNGLTIDVLTPSKTKVDFPFTSNLHQGYTKAFKKEVSQNFSQEKALRLLSTTIAKVKGCPLLTKSKDFSGVTITL